MPHKAYRVSVTFEFDGIIDPLHQVFRVTASTPGAATTRALRDARKQWKARKPQSIVLVIDCRS
jgi:hypothetical protein